MRYLLPALLTSLLATTALAQTPPKPPPALTVLPNPGTPTNKGLEEAGLDAFLTEICVPDALLMAGYPIMGCDFFSEITKVVPGMKQYEDQPPLYVFEARLEIRRNERDEANPFWEADLRLHYGSEAMRDRPWNAGVSGVITAKGGNLMIRSDDGVDVVPLFLSTHGASVSEVAKISYYDGGSYTPMSFEFGRDPSDFNIELQFEEAGVTVDP